MCNHRFYFLFFSGDGTLSVCNLRRNKVTLPFPSLRFLISLQNHWISQFHLLAMFLWQVQAQSEFSEDELLSVVIMKVPFPNWLIIILLVLLIHNLKHASLEPFYLLNKYIQYFFGRGLAFSWCLMSLFSVLFSNHFFNWTRFSGLPKGK